MNAPVKDSVRKFADAMTIGYLAGLRGEDPDSEMSHVHSNYDEGWLMGDADRERGVPAPKYLGYHDDLPIKQGQIVTIKKGTMVRCNGVTKPAGRTYKITIHHILPGQNLYVEGNAFRRTVHPVMTPKVVWPGSGGYWAEADINDIPEAQ